MEKTDYKALVTDLDGTAVPVGSLGESIDKATKDAVRKADQNGKLIACASGREWAQVKPVVKKLGISAPCIIEGGTRLIDPVTEKTLWQKNINVADIKPLQKMLQDLVPEETIKHSGDNKHTNAKDVTQLPKPLQYLYILAIKPALAKRISQHISDHLPNATAHATPAWIGKGLSDVHVTHQNATKEQALNKWHQLTGCTKAQTIALGDSPNDLPLFKSASLKLAVKNADKALKSEADATVPAVDNGGLRYAIEQYLLT